MAKRVRDANLESRAARAKLRAVGKPYYKTIGPGLHVGYRKGKRGGKWVVRRNIGGGYKVETIAMADDVTDADGRSVLDFWQAQERAWSAAKTERPAGPYKVRDAVVDYLAEIEGRASYRDTQLRLEAYALPAFGDRRVDELTADTLRKWHRALAKAPRRIRTKRGGAQRIRAVDLRRNGTAAPLRLAKHHLSYRRHPAVRRTPCN